MPEKTIVEGPEVKTYASVTKFDDGCIRVEAKGDVLNIFPTGPAGLYLSMTFDDWELLAESVSAAISQHRAAIRAVSA